MVSLVNLKTEQFVKRQIMNFYFGCSCAAQYVVFLLLVFFFSGFIF